MTPRRLPSPSEQEVAPQTQPNCQVHGVCGEASVATLLTPKGRCPLTQGKRVPTFAVQNHQETHWIKETPVIILPDGTVEFLEELATPGRPPISIWSDFRSTARSSSSVSFPCIQTTQAIILRRVPSGSRPSPGNQGWIREHDRMQMSTDFAATGPKSQHRPRMFWGRGHFQYPALRIVISLQVLMSVSPATFFLDEPHRQGFAKLGEASNSRAPFVLEGRSDGDKLGGYCIDRARRGAAGFAPDESVCPNGVRRHAPGPEIKTGMDRTIENVEHRLQACGRKSILSWTTTGSSVRVPNGFPHAAGWPKSNPTRRSHSALKCDLRRFGSPI